MKKLSFVFAVLVIFSMVLTACSPSATPTVEPTVAIEQFEPTAADIAPTAASDTTEETVATEVPETTEAAEAATGEIDTEATLTVALETILSNLDYMTNSSLNAAGIFELMFDRLVDLDEDVTLQPMVATEWSISEDGKVWTFKLRDDVKFWDGEPLTAEDVKYTLERMQIDDYNIGNTAYLNSQFNFDKAVVVDDYTIEIHTTSPVPALLYTLEEINILPEHFYKDLTPEQAATQIMGSGPFMYVSFSKDDNVEMTRNDNYWGNIPQYKTLVYRQIADSATRIAELETGGVDIIQSVPMSDYETVDGLDTAHVSAISNGCRQYLGFNLESEIYSDKRLRLAINHAIDWESINQAFFRGSAPRMVTNVNKPWLNEDLVAYDYNLDTVDSLMTEMGYEKDADGYWAKDGVEMAPSIMVYYAQTSERYEVLLSLVDQLNKAGFKADPYYLDQAAAMEKLDNREIDDMFFIGSCTSYEGQGDISDLEADSGSNYGRWNNADFEALYTQLLAEFDNTKRKELLDQMEQIVYDESPIVPLWIRIDVWGINDKVDWSPNPTGRAQVQGAVIYK